MNKFRYILFVIASLALVKTGLSQNPIINSQFTADPTARVFDGKLYLYPSHDIPCGKGEGYIGFCMADYHVFSTDNLTDWKDHGVIFTQNDVPWAATNSFSMWAPDCVYKNSKYYFYFPVIEKDSVVNRVRRIGVATSDYPFGPFVPEKNFIQGIRGIDPNVFIGKDGQAYFYWANKKQIYASKLKENMLELETEPQVIETPTDKFKEGPFVFERNGIYYLTYPMVRKNIEVLVYGMGKHPLGPFEYKGLIMKESPIGCWTNHHSIVNYKDQWFLFYHHNDYSPGFDKNRSVKIDSLFFNDDGTIREVIPTLRGVGISNATNNIHIDRYSLKSNEGVSVEFLDTLDYLKGWKVEFNKPEAWVSYNQVDLNNFKLKKILINAISAQGGKFEIRLNGLNGKVIAKGSLEKSLNWSISKFKINDFESGTYDLYFICSDSAKIEIDFIKFE